MKQIVVVISLIAGLQLLAGCGSSSKNTGTHLYAVNSSAGTINTYNIQGDGSLASGSSFNVGANAQSLALVTAGSGASTSVKSFAYVVSKNQSAINVYNVDTNGVFTASSTASAVQDTNYPTQVVADPSGLYLYTADSGATGSPGISVYTINSTSGAITLSGSTPLSLPPSFLLLSSGFLYAAIPTSGVIEAFSVNSSNGTLTELAAALGPIVSAGVKPTYLALSGAYLLSADNGGNTVYTFQIQSGQGNLLSVAGSPFAAGLSPSAIALNSSSQVFVANENANTITAYTVNGTGQLTPISGASYATKGSTPVALAIAPGGNAIYAADSASSNIDEFQITDTNSTLAVTAFSGSPIAAGGSPVALIIK